MITGTLKESIQHEVRLFEPKSLENAFSLAMKVETKKKVATKTYREENVPPQPHLANRVDSLASGGKKSKGTMFKLCKM